MVTLRTLCYQHHLKRSKIVCICSFALLSSIRIWHVRWVFIFLLLQLYTHFRLLHSSLGWLSLTYHYDNHRRNYHLISSVDLDFLIKLCIILDPLVYAMNEIEREGRMIYNIVSREFQYVSVVVVVASLLSHLFHVHIRSEMNNAKPIHINWIDSILTCQIRYQYTLFHRKSFLFLLFPSLFIHVTSCLLSDILLRIWFYFVTFARAGPFLILFDLFTWLCFLA